MLRRWTTAVGLTVMLAGCGSSGPPPSTAPEVPTPASAEPSPTATDTSIEDALAIAGVDDALAAELGGVAARTGYGIDPTAPDQYLGFALIQVSTCRDVAAGASTWRQQVDADVADGASRSDAEQMYEFLRTRFCPVVRPDPAVSSPVASRPAGTGTAQDDNGTRGILSTLEWIARRYRPITYTECERQLGQPFGEPHAYRVSASQIVCLDVVSGHWDGRPINASLVFSPPTSEAKAITAGLALLPTDATEDSREAGHSRSGGGGCLSVELSSQTLAEAVQKADADWSEPEKAAIVLYSGQQTNQGSSASYDPGHVRQTDVGIGGHNRGGSGSITC